MLAFLACLFYAVYCIGVLALFAFTYVAMHPTKNMAIGVLMEREIAKHGEQKFYRIMLLSIAGYIVLGKLLYIICWHFA